MIGIDKLRELAESVSGVVGDVAEIGVYQGESAVVLRELFPSRRLHLFDTFSGHPESMYDIDIDGTNHVPGKYNTRGHEAITELFDDGVEIHAGIFPETAIDVPMCFVHVDCDLYASTKAALLWARQNVTSGGLILCDDFAMVPSAHKAWLEVMDDLNTVVIQQRSYARIA